MREKREKAINFFQDMQECTYGNLEEVDMAIHALEQELNVIDELEQIKTDLEKLSENEWNKQVGADKGLELAIDVIEDRIAEMEGETDKEYEAKVITRGNCMMCGKELTEGLFFCKKCENNIKALNQEPILDKIRAEIEQNAYPIVYGVNNHEKGMTVYGILQIIDKYKKESEK